MNKQLQAFARSQILEGLLSCTTAQQTLFRRMYPHTRVDASLKDTVDNMTDEQLDCAMDQVRRTVEKNERQSAEAAGDAV